MLHLWYGLPSAACVLCDAQNCTLHHVLVKCVKSLNDGRYTWRHDSVLINIEHALANLLCQQAQGTKRDGPSQEVLRGLLRAQRREKQRPTNKERKHGATRLLE